MAMGAFPYMDICCDINCFDRGIYRLYNVVKQMISQILIIFLMLDAAWVAYGLARKRNMWHWIVAYWIILTLKNLADYFKR